MLFGRLRVPVERALSPEPRDRYESGFHVVADTVRDEAPHSPRAHQNAPPRAPTTRLTLVRQAPSASGGDEFAGLDRLDREELDEKDEE